MIPMAETAVRPKLEESCAAASELRDQGKGRIITFSPKVFIPLTRLCRDFCSYCTYRQSPKEATQLYMTAEAILEVARAGERQGCREALFVLGERPEQRYPQARRWLRDQGYDSSLHYLHDMCELVLKETALYPHSNPGTMTRREMVALKEVNVSLGLMLESTSLRLLEPGEPHEHAPSKRPQVRLRTLRQAGELKIPFTTGLLIGIGETARERIDALKAIGDLHRQYHHIQEVIIQNFRAKPHTPMAVASEPTVEEILETTALARITMGKNMNIQVPPNLSMHNGDASYLVYLKAGINDWGGISPVTIDYVNPEAPWPHIGQMSRLMTDRGFELKARFPVYPEYILGSPDYLPDILRQRLQLEADVQGYIRKAENYFGFGAKEERG
jgi:FO synthase